MTDTEIVDAAQELITLYSDGYTADPCAVLVQLNAILGQRDTGD